MNTALGRYGRLLLARWRWIMWGILMALAATTALLIIQPPLYRSEATVFVRTPGDVSRVVDAGDSYAQSRAATFAALANSTSLSSLVIDDLGLKMKPEVLSKRIRASHRPGTALIDISVSAPSAAEAQREATVLLSEYTATVRSMESVPGSLVPRSELVVVDPPSPPVRVLVWGVPIPAVLAGAILIGSLVGALGAVLRSDVKTTANEQDDATTVAEPPARDVARTAVASVQSAAIADGDRKDAGGRHRRK
jgi:capsular polysaccharide biosynthesis protein